MCAATIGVPISANASSRAVESMPPDAATVTVPQMPFASRKRRTAGMITNQGYTFAVRRRGFTILEVLIVVAIIGIIAAIAIANYLNAAQRTRQKRTMADMRSIGVAWESRAVDTKAYNAAGFSMPAALLTYAELTTLLAPTYMRNIPSTDGWGHALQFATDQPIGGRSASEYAIRSPGRDGVFAGSTYASGPTTSFDCDIVYSGGAFVVWPEGVQTTH